MAEDRVGGLRAEVSNAARQAFTDLRRKHPKERLYGFVLFTTPLFSYVAPSANSEEALDGGEDWRWNPPDWKYHVFDEKPFAPAQKLLQALDVAEHGELRERVFDALLGALADLDAEGLFGTGEQRERILLNVMWGDQDLPVHLLTAERLNPKSTFLRYAAHELLALKSIIREMRRCPDAKPALARAKTLLDHIEKLGELD